MEEERAGSGVSKVVVTKRKVENLDPITKSLKAISHPGLVDLFTVCMNR